MSTCSHVLARLLGNECQVCAAVERAEREARLLRETVHTLVTERPERRPRSNKGIPQSPWARRAQSDGAAAYLERVEHALASGDLEDMIECLRQLDEAACRASLYEFFRLAFKITNPGVELEDGKHIQAVCDHVQWQLEDRAECVANKRQKLKVQNLLINIPPRSLKTTILTCATVWAWLRWPTLKMMYLSANPRVASTSARMARDLMNSTWFKATFKPSWQVQDLDEEGNPLPDAREPDPQLEIRQDQDALSDMGNTLGGARYARGLASQITGEGCDWLIIDDPHDVKDGLERVAKAVEDYDGAVANRLNNPRTGIRTLIMQRVRTNDLSSRWIAIGGKLLHLRLPMEYETEEQVECKCGTCVGRNVFGFKDWRTKLGETLHERFDAAFIQGEKDRLQSRYVGQHQQRPASSGGQIFKIGWWEWCSLTTTEPCARPVGARLSPAHLIGRRRDGSLDLDWLCVSIDATGGSTSDTASNLGIGIIGGKELRRFLLEDCTDGPKTWLQTLEVARNVIMRAVRIAGKQPRIVVLVEKKALGQAAIEQLTDYIRSGQLKYPDGKPIIAAVEAYEPTGKGDKRVRAEMMEPDIAAGLLHLLDGAPWVGPFRAELEDFPKAPHDDRVDYLSQCLDFFRQQISDWGDLFRRAREEEQARIAAANARPRTVS